MIDWYPLFKPLLFSQKAENAHHLTMTLFQLGLELPLIRQFLHKSFFYDHPQLHKEVMGLNFRNPLGLAAGFDKDAMYIMEMEKLGFGFIEIGTVTPRPQAGNPKPRLFRIKQDHALINRMGFNNEGVLAAVGHLKKYRKNGLIIGGNIGKNKETENDRAKDDYLYCFDSLHPYVDYFVVNISSPNTPGLRSLQAKKPLTEILKVLQEKNADQPKPKPILVKIAPDLTKGQLLDIVEIIENQDLDGIVATNTTISRDHLSIDTEKIAEIGNGGLSGRPLKEKALEVLSILRQHLSEGKTIIGVGGIETAIDAKERLNAGADLIQIYSGLIYQGPYLVKKIKTYLAEN